MSETLITIPKSSLERFLKPVNRLNESCVIRSQKDYIYTVCSSADNSIILYAKTNIPNEIENDIKLNIINIKKLLTGLHCLGDDGEFKMIYNKNHIVCKSVNSINNDNTHFRYHLVDDDIIRESPINVASIINLNFDTTFEIGLDKIKKILNAYSFATDVNKIYFYSKDDKIFADIDDKTMDNMDNVSLLISDTFNGQIVEPMSIKIEIFKLFVGTKNPIKVKINNQYKVFVFTLQEDTNTELKYIISALVK